MDERSAVYSLYVAAYSTVVSVIGAAHLAMFLDRGNVVDGWAALTCLVLSLPGWLFLYVQSLRTQSSR